MTPRLRITARTPLRTTIRVGTPTATAAATVALATALALVGSSTSQAAEISADRPNSDSLNSDSLNSDSLSADSMRATTLRAGGVGADAISRSNVPDALAVPAGQTRIADLSASGVQIYQCTAGAWTFLEPAATLNGRTTLPPRSSVTAVHFRGPSWQSTRDGSLVQATSVASVPVAGSIPELLLRATVNRGTGIFGSVSYIQRLRTTGGTAPVGACTDNATVGVPYTARYRFFAPTSTPTTPPPSLS